MFVQGYVTVFLCLCDLGSKRRHKATTSNCVPQVFLLYFGCESSLPIMGGGGTMKKFRKFDLLILILKLLVHLIDWFK